MICGLPVCADESYKPGGVVGGKQKQESCVFLGVQLEQVGALRVTGLLDYRT